MADEYGQSPSINDRISTVLTDRGALLDSMWAGVQPC
jgi:hypothetical protein